MPVIVSCPKCGVGLKVPEEFLGKLVRCPRCQEAVPTKAPAPAPSAAIMAEPVVRKEAVSAEPPRSPFGFADPHADADDPTVPGPRERERSRDRSRDRD